jgi:P-type Cu2+ transporter
VVFDKTGTLTMGVPEADQSVGSSPRRAGSRGSAGRGLVTPAGAWRWRRVRAAGVYPARVENLREVPGYGVEGIWHGRRVRLGRAEWCGGERPAVTATYLARAKGPHAPLPLPTACAPARKRLLRLWRTGQADHPSVGRCPGAGGGDLAATGGPFRMEALAPACRERPHVSGLTAQGARVLMVGDGLNDTAALAAAHVSISPASALDAARVASDIVLLGQDMAPIADAVRIGGRRHRASRRTSGYRALTTWSRCRWRWSGWPHRCGGAGHVAVVDHRFAERAEAEVMEILALLIPVSLLLGGVGLIAFFWAAEPGLHNRRPRATTGGKG